MPIFAINLLFSISLIRIALGIKTSVPLKFFGRINESGELSVSQRLLELFE